jgi:antitoxin (DNA-binding transcriptional repressor) of toxin-antitoxin stability system
MKTATVEELQKEFARVAAWIENGEEIDIIKSGKVFARLIPVHAPAKDRLVKVDFARQLRKTWGGRTFSATEMVAMRKAEFEGEEG